MILGLLYCVKDINDGSFYRYIYLTSGIKAKVCYRKDVPLGIVLCKEFSSNEDIVYRAFNYSESDWEEVFEEYVKIFKIGNRLSFIFVNAIYCSRDKIDIESFAKAVRNFYAKLGQVDGEIFLNNMWKISRYASINTQKRIERALNLIFSNRFIVKENATIKDATIFAINNSSNLQEPYITRLKNIENHGIFAKIDVFDAVIKSIANRRLESSNTLINILLWKNGIIEGIEINNLRTYYNCFSYSDKLLMLKKLFYLHKTRRINITTNLLIQILEANNEIKHISDLIRHPSVTSLGIEIIIYSLDQFNNNKSFINKNRIFELLYESHDLKKQVSLNISSYMDMCDGGCLEYPRSYYNKGICNGRLSNSKEKKSNVDFLWCDKEICLKNSIHLHNCWEEYTFVDFCHILGFPAYEEKECGMIPKKELSKFFVIIEKFLIIKDKFYCEECGCILIPVKRSNKEFISNYSTYSCSNPQCKQHINQIYLNHCYEKNCGGIIDSRHQKRCPNGLYICPECRSCCSTKLYQRQAQMYDLAEIPIPKRLMSNITNEIGHNDKGIYYCPNCGEKLVGDNCVRCNTK